jgi:hypothetical protein
MIYTPDECPQHHLLATPHSLVVRRPSKDSLADNSEKRLEIRLKSSQASPMNAGICGQACRHRCRGPCHRPLTDHKWTINGPITENRTSYSILFLLVYLTFSSLFLIIFDQILDVMSSVVSSPPSEARSPPPARRSDTVSS